jgi:hypothetical protein
MRVIEQPFPTGLFVHPNAQHAFGELTSNANLLDLVEQFRYGQIALVGFTRSGGLAIAFDDCGPLKSVKRLTTVGSGTVPDAVAENQDEILNLQFKRFEFANFLAGAIFGRLSALTHSGLMGAYYVAMSDAMSCGLDRSGELRIPPQPGLAQVVKAQAHSVMSSRSAGNIVTPEHLSQIIGFLDHLSLKEKFFRSASLQRCMLMNYQAAILHEQQQSSASLAVNFSVAEALIDEIFWGNGLVGKQDVPDRGDAKPKINISRSEFKKKWIGEKVDTLYELDIISGYLRNRLSNAKKARNDLMHRNETVHIRQSGELQTVVRDLWAFLLDLEFELNASFAYRI